MMALAMLGAYALVSAWRSSAAWKAVSVVLVLAYLALSMPMARLSAEWFRERSVAVKTLVMGVARAHELHPGKTILLDGIGDELFWGAIVHRPFLFIRVPDVYLAPGSEASITSHPDLGNISQYILPAAETRRGLASKQIVVYRAGEGPLRNITTRCQVPAGLE